MAPAFRGRSQCAGVIGVGLSLFLLGVLAGCGYSLSGQPGTIPGSLQRIAVPMFNNTTAVPGLERLLTAAVRERLLRDGRVHLVTDTGSAAVLRGDVMDYRVQLLASTLADFAIEYRIETEVRVRVEDVHQRSLIPEQRVTATAEYIVSEGLVPTEIARERALQAAARAMGERIVSLVLDRF